MSKWLLTGWLLAPFAVVAGLWMVIDRDAARKARDEMAALALERRAAERTQPAPASPSTPDPKADMIRPEYLPQGFILVVKDLTGLANANSPIHLASSWNGWDPGDTKQVLTPRSDLRWQIVIEKGRPDTPIAFKFTRGSWDLEELDESLTAINNRSLPMVDKNKLAPGERPVFEFEVVKWGDQRPNSAQRPDLDPYYDLKTSGNVKRLQVPGGATADVKNGQRDLLVYLPPGYGDASNKDRRYPVLYLQDGQNLFMKLPGVPAEWGADETADELIRTGKVEPLIIVGIPHTGALRAVEYSPFPIVPGLEPKGAEYVEWLVGQVMPRVERAFRVQTGAASTGIGGASLGAVIAAEAAMRHPDLFGKLLLESMAGLGEKQASVKHFVGATQWPERVWFGFGSAEAGRDEKQRDMNRAMVDGAKAMEKVLLSRQGTSVVIKIEDTVHSEEAWASRFGEALRFLYPAKR